jgi:hypothetical protein
MAINGAIRSMTISGRGFKVAHDGSGNKQLGGRNNEVQMNSDGSFRTIQTVMPGAINDVNVEIDDSRNDLEFLQTLATDGLPVPVVMTYASNISYTGDLVLTGEIQKDENTGLAALSFQGGKLQKI